jgi:U6 snRNA-associated Sm-like protein LSm4
MFFYYQENFLKQVKDKSVLIECKRGFTCNGKIIKFDSHLNIFMENSILTIKKGMFFKEIKQLFLKGNIIKYIKII